MVNKHFLGFLFLLHGKIILKPKKKLNNVEILLHKMTRQSLKLAKFMTNQVVNAFGHVQQLSIISTPEMVFNNLCSNISDINKRKYLHN